MIKKTSLKDIAKNAGVSTSLVSYVLNNKLEGRINKKTAEKIRQVASEMHYSPNQIAKSLKSSKTYTIGLIVADISNPFSSSLARIIEDEAKKYKYTVIFGSADESNKKTQELITVLLSRQVDGFIIAPPEGFDKYLATLHQQNIPFVLIDRYFPGSEANHVVINNYKSSFDATTHLIKNGFRKIGMVNLKSKLYHLNERTNGYKRALKDAGLESNCYIRTINEKNIKREITEAINELVYPPNSIDALFFATNNIALEGLSFIKEKKVRVPKDLGIVCFDETNAYNLFDCPLTYVRQPLVEIGQQAVQLLLEGIEENSKYQNLFLETELVIKRSSSK